MDRKDRIFEDQSATLKPFEFNEKVAHVFDDMAGRSIPYYDCVERMTASLAATFWQPDTQIYDLGCSTATCSLLMLEEIASRAGRIPDGLAIQAIDSSAAMCTEARDKISRSTQASSPISVPIHVRHSDILKTDIRDASVVVMNYTLQFVPPLKREPLVRRIFEGLVPNGVLLVSDKTLQTHTDVSRIFIDKYYDYKREHGYSDLEIARKREALENVLIPYQVSEEQRLFEKCGFDSVDTFFCWYNFSSFICVKR